MRIKILWVLAVILFLIVTFLPQTQGAPKAIVYEMDVTASPAVQGKKLPIDIQCEVGFGGACCYSVYAHDVQAEIIIPENVTLTGGNKIQVITSSGQSSGTVAVDPGGGLTRLSKTWSIEAEEYGIYNITVIIMGENELGEQIYEIKSVIISIISGASISTPILPREPSTGKDTIIVTEVSSSDSNVANVTLFYSKNQENWISLPMENSGGEVWTGIIPKQESEGEIYYYMESLDDEDKAFTTEIYSLEIKDTAKIGMIKLLATYGTLSVFILGIALIIFIGRRTRTQSSRKGMVILGASLRLSALRDLDEISDDQERLRKIRKWIALILIIAMIILLVVAIITGQLQDVISHTTNPTEA